MYTPIDELIEEFRRTWMDFGMAESAPMYDPGRRYKRQDAEDSTEALKAAIERLQAENVALHEQVAALESREVCTVAHDDVETCGYCQRDALRAEVDRLRAALQWYAKASLTDFSEDEWGKRARAALEESK